MEALVTIIAIFAGLAALGVASITWGADSRDVEPRDIYHIDHHI